MFGFGKKPNHLPEPRGPHVAGAADLMIDYSIDGVFIRVYYPTNASKDDNNNYRKWIPWVPDSYYADGIASVLMLLPIIVRGLMWWSGNTYIPVIYGEHVRIDKNGKMKCIILSHGLGGSRFLYSTICSELASQGFIVFAIEHRDRTAPYTYYYQSEEHAQADSRTSIRYKRVHLDNGHFEKRNEQVKQRSKECGKVLDFILAINSGNVPHNIIDDVKKERPSNFKLSDLVGRLDVDNIIMMGHSFGGATALLTLAARTELKLGILLDPWMFPIKNDKKLYAKVKQPLLFVNTQTFHVSSNTEAMSRYLEGSHREMYTLLHTTHENQTDSVLLIGYWLNWFMKKLDPYVALRINNSLILKFINSHTEYPKEVTEFEDFINEQSRNIDKGLTRAWI